MIAAHVDLGSAIGLTAAILGVVSFAGTMFYKLAVKPFIVKVGDEAASRVPQQSLQQLDPNYLNAILSAGEAMRRALDDQLVRTQQEADRLRDEVERYRSRINDLETQADRLTVQLHSAQVEIESLRQQLVLARGE